MTAYLAYSYSTGLTKKEQIEIDEKTKKSREEFTKGFVKGTSFSLAAYSLYSMTTSAAHAANSNVPANECTGEISPAPTKPGFKPVSDGARGAFVGGATGVCGAALQSGDFLLGLACAVMLVVGGIVFNRPPE